MLHRPVDGDCPRRVAEKAASSSLDILTFVTSGDAEAEELAIGTLARTNLRGLVYGTIQTRAVTPSRAVLDKPTVLLNCYVTDRERGIGHAGRRWWAGVRPRGISSNWGTAASPSSRAKTGWMPPRTGSRATARPSRRRISPSMKIARPGNWEPSAGYAQTKEMMQSPHPPTAIFCCNDLMALGCLEALRELAGPSPAMSSSATTTARSRSSLIRR